MDMAMLGVNVSGLTGGFLGMLVVAGRCSVDGSLSCPMCTRVLEILFASDFELARVVSLDPSLDPNNPYAQLLEEGPARSRLLDEEELVCRCADGDPVYG